MHAYLGSNNTPCALLKYPLHFNHGNNDDEHDGTPISDTKRRFIHYRVNHLTTPDYSG